MSSHHIIEVNKMITDHFIEANKMVGVGTHPTFPDFINASPKLLFVVS